MTQPPDPGLVGHLAALAAELADVDEVRNGQGGIEWRRAGVPFAAAPTPDEAHFRLDGPIAAAALRTPDTEPSASGRDWVALRPAIADAHALDRAGAWFEAAWRRAGTAPRGANGS